MSTSESISEERWVSIGQELPTDLLTGSHPSAPLVVSTTLVGASKDVVTEAITSVVDWVDLCLLIDTGANDGSIDIARSAAGDKAIVRSYTWCNDFAHARNFAIDQATDLGAHWAVTVDADERMLIGDFAIRDYLASTKAGCLFAQDDARTYWKVRFFLLPCPVRYEGPTHESFEGFRLNEERLFDVQFVELGKSDAQLRSKRLRDIEILTAYTQEHPNDPRWFYYLGDSYDGVGQLDEAVAAFDACQALRGWNEEAAWACYRAAWCKVARDELQAAIDWSAKGLVHHPGIAELAWTASFATHKLGRHHEAVYWARISEALGCFKGIGDQVHRIGFRAPKGLYEGPYDVLRFSLASIGDVHGAALAQAQFEQAELKRGAKRP
jgi:tetratricopeptide (TPR) repeat protein